MDPRVVDRWMAIELGRIHEGLVRAPRHLADLLLEDAPTAPTRDGLHAFDRAALRDLAAALPVLTRARLRLPILVHLATDAPGDACILDEAAQRALADFGVARAAPREGKLWLGEPLPREVARRFPTCVQFAFG